MSTVTTPTHSAEVVPSTTLTVQQQLPTLSPPQTPQTLMNKNMNTTSSYSSTFSKLARTILSNNDNTIPPTTPLYSSIEEGQHFLPVIKTRPPSIPTKHPYPLFLNPDNVSSANNTLNQPIPVLATSTAFTSLTTHPKLSRDQHEGPPQIPDSPYLTSPYGPHPFTLSPIPSFPRLDDAFNINPTWYSSLASNLVIQAIGILTMIGVRGNNVYLDCNNNLIQSLVNSNAKKAPEDPSKRPIITFSNHNSTIDDPFILVATHPDQNVNNCRWEICGQDICYPTAFIGGGFMSGRVLPIQRGSGLWQPHFTRLHNLLSNNQWIHIFPEGKVQFTPNFTGEPRDLADPPSSLLPFKWGIGSLVSESLLRGESPALIPMVHTSARIHPRSQGVPDFHKEASILVGDDSLSHIKPIVDGYINYVNAYESGNITCEPSKELLFIEVSNRLKHILDRMYYNCERHYKIPITSALFQGRGAPESPKLLLDPCTPKNCFCKHDDAFPLRQASFHHAKLAHHIHTDHRARWNKFTPWYNQYPHVLSHNGRFNNPQHQIEHENEVKLTQVDTTVAAIRGYYNNWVEFVSTPSPTVEQRTDSFRPISSTHDLPCIYRVKNRKYMAQWNANNIWAHYIESNIDKYVKNKQWGSGKYQLGLDGCHPQIYDKDNNFTTSTIVDSIEKYPYHSVWKARWLPSRAKYIHYLAHVNGFVIDQALFDKTWDEFMRVDYTTRADSLQEFYKQRFDATHNHAVTSQHQPYDPQNDPVLNKDKEYLAEILLIRNRLNVLKNTPTFDWNDA